MIRLPLLIGLVFTSLAAGCGTMRPFDALTGRQTADQTTVADASSRPWSGLASRFRKSDPESDALILDKQALSEGFQKSRGGLTTKGLRDPEATNLAFARWKEDVGQYAESKARYHEVLTANPNCLTARLGIARIERETGRYDQCHDILMAARKHHPNDPAVMLELGRMYNARERWDESIRSFTDAAQLAPDDLTVRYELGLALASVDRTQEAMPHLKFAVGESAAYYNIGFILSERGRAEEAVQWIERTMATHPNVRTRHMAMDLLAELESSLPASRGFTEPSSAVAASGCQPVALTIGSRFNLRMGKVTSLLAALACLLLGACGEDSSPGGETVAGSGAFSIVPERALHRRSGIMLVRVPPGSFVMGASKDEAGRDGDEHQREVEVTEPFYLGETEVTVGQWRRVMGRPTPVKQQDEAMPLKGVTWYVAKEFVEQLNAQGGGGWRLPTEVEWEYACRAGTTTPFSFGEALDPSLAHYDGRRPYKDGERTKTSDDVVPVRSLPANPWGFFAMHGNVWEWCEDLYLPNVARDLPPPNARGASRSIRGGGFSSRGDQLRSAYRDGYPPLSTGEKYGFRVAWSPN